MSRFITLPAPLPSGTIVLGQLISDPHDTQVVSSKPSRDLSITQSKQAATNDGVASHTQLTNPQEVFNTLRQDSTTRSFLRRLAHDNKPAYFITGIQTHPNAKVSQYRLPVRRVDSASNLDAPGAPIDGEKASSDSIVAVELREVKCRVGAPSEPHCVADVEYDWSYHSLDEEGDVQLSIGLGRIITAGELRALAGARGVETEERGRGVREVEGLGGF